MRRALLIASVVALLGLAPQAGAAPAAQRSGALETAVVEQVNALRLAYGLPALDRSSGLRRAADAHTLGMLRTGSFAHVLPGGPTLAQRVSRFYPRTAKGWSTGENIALFGPDAPSAKAVLDAWLGSPAHRANLLRRDWRHIGVSARFAAAPPGDFGFRPSWLITLDLGRKR